MRIKLTVANGHVIELSNVVKIEFEDYSEMTQEELEKMTAEYFKYQEYLREFPLHDPRD